VALDQLPAYLLLGRANGGTLYFIPVLLSLYIIYPALIKARNALGWDVFLLLCLCFSALSEYTDLQYAAVSWDANPLSLAFFGRLLFVFAAGMYLSRVNMERLMGWAAAVIAFCVSIAAIVLVGQQGFHFFSYFFGPVAFSCLLLAVHRGIADVVRIITWVFEQLGKNSLIIYMTHSTLLYMVLKPNFTAYQGAEAFFILVLLTTALSYAFSLIFMKAYRVVLQALGVSEVKSA
jgi:hypothetical protein